MNTKVKMKKNTPKKLAKKSSKKTSLKFSRNIFSLKRGLIFALCFAVIGSIYVVISKAATLDYIIEAEAMTLTNQALISDSNASNQKAVAFSQNGSASVSVNLSGDALSMSLRARGDQCQGSPLAILKFDDTTVFSFTVSNSVWDSHDHTFVTPLVSGSHTLKIEYGNDFIYRGKNSRKNCDRNLYIDSITFQIAQIAVTPPPTTTTPPPTMDMTQIPADQLPVGSAGSSQLLSSFYPNPTANSSGDGTGNARFVCKYSHMSYNDPIVNPNQPGAAHLHTFFGNKSTDSTSTYNSLRSATNSTCSGGGGANKTAYWIPTLMQSGKPLAPKRAHIYYKSGYRLVPPSAINELPAGLAMVAGNKNSLTAQHGDIVSWGCGGTSGNGVIPVSCAAGSELELTVTFPQCWDGLPLSGANHSSHLRYPGAYPQPPGTVGSYGDGCTKETGYTKPIPVITILSYWDVPSTGTSGLRLSSDLPDAKPGASAHADFMEAWDPPIRKLWTDNCIRNTASCTREIGNNMYLIDPS